MAPTCQEEIANIPSRDSTIIHVMGTITNKKNYETNEITFAGVRIVCACNYRNNLQYNNYRAVIIDILHRFVSVE